MIKYVNSPLKITGSILLLAGVALTVFPTGQLLFLGFSIVMFGGLIYYTAYLLLRSNISSMKRYRIEIILAAIVSIIMQLLLLDLTGLIKLNF